MGLPRSQKEWINLRAIIARNTRDGAHAEDRLQSGLEKLLSQMGRVKNVEGFLVRASRNLMIDEIRKKSTRREVAFDTVGLQHLACDDALPDEVLSARRRLNGVTKALDTLPGRTRRIFLMHRLDGMRYRDIAAREQVSLSSVEKHIAKAMLLITQWDEAD